MNLNLPFAIPAIPARLHFEHQVLDCFEIASQLEKQNERRICGTISGLAFEAVWKHDPENGWHRFSICFQGRPDPAWGAFRQLTLLDLEAGNTPLFSDMGWYEYSADEKNNRPAEEGGGRLPKNGYPVFGETFFLGIEHPVSCVEQKESHVRLYHHPVWKGDALVSETLIIGLARQGETAAEAFARYMEAIRLPKPERAVVEINTFWTDQFANGRYTTDLESYREMARAWAEDVLKGERGLVSHFLLDAGWQEVASLYRPQASNGGPGDEALAALGKKINALGFEFGLWISLNGPIGVDMDWAAANGYRTFNQGLGAGYSCMDGKIRYLCLTDERWEEDLSRRFEELIDHVPVTFFKDDWDNDAVEDPEGFPSALYSEEQRREAIANAMMRIYSRIHRRRPGLLLRGAWWLSPWWLPYVDNTHLPNSGDMESSGFPSLAQREAGVTCRDAIYYHVVQRRKTPFPIDAICPHEFASSRRNPVHDTPESWMNTLAMWVSRGSHYLQLYLAPYGLGSWKAWSLREILRWFRANEDLLWKKGSTEMLGGDPVSGAVYGYLHRLRDEAFLTVRNPLARPQPLPEWVPQGWTQIYPFFSAEAPAMLPSQGVVVFAAHVPAPDRPRVNTPEGWKTPLQRRPLPALHQLGEPRAWTELPGPATLAIHAVLPYTLENAEVVLQVRMPMPTTLRASLSRYPDGVAAFPVPVTSSHAGSLKGYSMTRLNAPLPDPEVVYVRLPIGTGGEAHAFLNAEPALPVIEGGWIEGFQVLEQCAFQSPQPLPPAPDSVREVICEVERR